MKDKETLKKNQHYVPQKYLKSWKGDTSVWTLLIDKGVIEPRNTKSIAQEKYFYKLSEINSNQVIFIDALIRKRSHDSLKEMQLNSILGAFVEYSKLKQELGKSPTDVEQQRLKLLEVNYFENMHERIENIGERLIQCESLNEFENIFSNYDERLKAITFLMAQYFRTKRMKGKFQTIDSSSLDIKNSNIWTILSFIEAQNLALQTSCLSANVVFLENNTTEKFLTSDQPVINLSTEKSSQKTFGNSFYYPITPRYGIILDSLTNNLENQGVFSTTSRTLSLNEVREYNGKIINNADKLIFSNNEHQLRQIISNPENKQKSTQQKLNFIGADLGLNI